jgi:hypothetical protein
MHISKLYLSKQKNQKSFFYSISVNTQNTLSLEAGERKFTFLSCSNTIIDDSTCSALMIAIRYSQLVFVCLIISISMPS